MKPAQGIDGYWVPIEVGQNSKLSAMSKFLFAIISSLDISEKGCFASNAFLISRLGKCSVNSLNNYLNELIEHQYITREVRIGKDHQTIRILRRNPNFYKQYEYLRYEANGTTVSQLNAELNELGGVPKLPGGGDPQDFGGGIPEFRKHNSISVTLESESEKESKVLLRKTSLTLSNTSPVGDVKEQVRSKLIRKPVIQSKLLRSKSSIIKNTPVTPSEIRTKEKQTELNLSLELIEIVNEWEDGLKIHAHTTKTFKQAVFCITKLLNGKMFNSLSQLKEYHNRKFTVQEIITAISNFKLAALSPDYHPIGNLKERFRKTLFSDFFYNPHALKYQSLFIEFFNNPPKSVIENTKLIPDVYPQLSKKLRKLYVENVLGDPNAKLLPQSENAFRRASAKLNDFKEKNKKRIVITEFNGNLATYLWEALENKVRNTSEITPYWFCSDTTFQETFPAYLYSQGVLQSLNEKEFSIYN
jgi:hypothetical protein